MYNCGSLEYVLCMCKLLFVRCVLECLDWQTACQFCSSLLSVSFHSRKLPLLTLCGSAEPLNSCWVTFAVISLNLDSFCFICFFFTSTKKVVFLLPFLVICHQAYASATIWIVFSKLVCFGFFLGGGVVPFWFYPICRGWWHFIVHYRSKITCTLRPV